MSLETPGPPPEILERKKFGIELRARYELYFVTATFTFAGLAIQTAKTGPGSVAEVGAWICFLVSGMIGLWRFSQLWRREFAVAAMYEASYEPSDREKKVREYLVLLDANLDGFYKIQFLLFIAALLLAGFARAALIF